jgi:hypothetical protein
VTTTIEGYEYQFSKLNAFDQYFLARKLSPVLGLLALQNNKEVLSEKFPQAFCALTAQLGEDESREIINRCLDAAQRKQQNAWGPVRVNGSVMYADVVEDLSVMLRVVWGVLEANRLVDFFTERPSAQTPANPPA